MLFESILDSFFIHHFHLLLYLYNKFFIINIMMFFCYNAIGR